MEEVIYEPLNLASTWIGDSRELLKKKRKLELKKVVKGEVSSI